LSETQVCDRFVLVGDTFALAGQGGLSGCHRGVVAIFVNRPLHVIQFELTLDHAAMPRRFS
jgi:hypothetical protein